MIKNIDRVRELKIRLRRCNLICADLEIVINLKEKTQSQQSEVLIKSLQLSTEIAAMQEILEKGD